MRIPETISSTRASPTISTKRNLRGRFLCERLAAIPHTWLECSASPYTEGTPFHPVIALVTQGLAFTPTDTTAEKVEKIERGQPRLRWSELDRRRFQPGTPAYNVRLTAEELRAAPAQV